MLLPQPSNFVRPPYLDESGLIGISASPGDVLDGVAIGTFRSRAFLVIAVTPGMAVVTTAIRFSRIRLAVCSSCVAPQHLSASF